MNPDYKFKCISCGKIFEKENAPEYVCPNCEKNQQSGKSLLGVLECIYDYENYNTKIINLKILKTKRAGKFSSRPLFFRL